MKQVSISSMVLDDHITCSYSSIEAIKGLKPHCINQNVPYWSVSNKELNFLVVELENLIEELIPKRSLTEKLVVLTQYKNDYYKLDLKNDFDWHVGMLIALYDMVVKTDKHDSHLYIFNKEMLIANNAESIIAYLRVHPWLNEQELYKGMKNLLKDSKSYKDITKQTIQKSLAQLISYGLVYFSKPRGEYSVTAVGYMCW